MMGNNISLANNLAVMTQLHIPGTAGRLSQQMRDLEQVAPLFVDAGLVRKIDKINPLSVRIAGISTKVPARQKIMGGFLYVAGAVRLDLLIEENKISTGTQDSVCEIDDIDFEDQRNRLKLISLRQAYELAYRAMSDGNHRDLIIIDQPILVHRSMVAFKDDELHQGHKKEYDATVEVIEQFWSEHKEKLYPWNPNGTVLLSVGSGHFGAVLELANFDLRDSNNHNFVLADENIDAELIQQIKGMDKAISNIGGQRFVHGLLNPYTRTAAYALHEISPRMEPQKIMNEGVIGFHYKADQGRQTRFAHMIGAVDLWTAKKLDKISAILMGMSSIGKEGLPLPLMLAKRELGPLDHFLQNYTREIKHHLRTRKFEDSWLKNISELD